MINEYFLQQAEALRPHLFHTERIVQGTGKALKDGESEIYDFGDHYVGQPSIRFGYDGHHPDAPLLFAVQFAEIRKSWIRKKKSARAGSRPAGSRKRSCTQMSFHAFIVWSADMHSGI